jgi:hypothetical protein
MFFRARTIAVLVGLLSSFVPATVYGQAPAANVPAKSVLGTVVAVDSAASSLTLKSDAGAQVLVRFSPEARFLRVAPGETNLRNGVAIRLADVAAGDRVMARGATSDPFLAQLLVLMSSADISSKQARDRQDWEQRGIQGTVTAITSGQITVRTRTAAGNAFLTITLAPNGVIRRYAPDSIRFADARPAAFTEIQVGDQIRARGDRTGDALRAQEIVAGTFRTIAATVLSATADEVRVTDLANKKPVTVRVNADTKLHRLAPGQNAATPVDIQALIDRSAALALTELKPGDALVISFSYAADRNSAITILAGVEPLLTRAGSQGMSLGSWSLEVEGGAP